MHTYLVTVRVVSYYDDFETSNDISQALDKSTRLINQFDVLECEEIEK